MELFDGHCDTILRCYEQGGGLWKNGGQLDLERTRKFGKYAQFFALFWDSNDIMQKTLDQAFQEEYAIFRRELEINQDLISFCRSGGEAEAAFSAGKTAAFLSVEGAELLDCSLTRLEEAHRLGVRAINLTWNHVNALSGTNAEETNQGLTPLGKEFVRRMDDLGILVDVSHLSDPGFWDVVELTKKPFFASHSNARGVFYDTRNLTDAQFTAIMKVNGVVGLNMYAGFLGEDPDFYTVISHLEHFLALGGEKNVSMGGDWDGVNKLPHGMDGIQDMDRLYETFLRRNYSETLVRGVFHTNMMRVVSEVCSM